MANVTTSPQVSSLAETGGTQVTGDLTLTEGANITITQSGNDFTIAGSGGGSVSFKEDGATIISGSIIDFIEPDTTLVTNSPAGTARVATSLYALLTGRTGGQILNGGTISSENLTLNANGATFSDTNTGRLTFGSQITMPLTFTVASATLIDSLFNASGTMTTGIASNVFPMVLDSRVIRYSVNQLLSQTPAFNASNVMTPTANGISDTASFSGFLAINSFTADTGGGNSATTSQLAGMVGGPTARSTTGSSTVTLMSPFLTYGTAFFTQDVGANTTVTLLAHFKARYPAVAGTIINHVGFDADTFTAASTLTASFRSAQNSGTGVWGFYHTGTANNAFTGNTKFGDVSAPTAKAHFAAHTTAAGSSPIKLTSGTAMTAPEDGALEFHGSHLYFTIAGVRYQLDQQSGAAGGIHTGVATINFGAFPGNSDTSLAITGQATIASGSIIWCVLTPVATADHTADEHLVETIKVFAGNIVVGTGFTIYALNNSEVSQGLTLIAGGRNTTLAGQLTRHQGFQQASAGGIGTRIYGTWSVAWAWA